MTPRRWHWLPQFAVFYPDRGRPMVGLIVDRDVRDTDEAASRRGRGQARRVSTCVTESYTNDDGGTSVIEFRIAFL